MGHLLSFEGTAAVAGARLVHCAGVVGGGVASEQDAGPAVDTNGHVAGNGHALTPAVRVAVVEYGVVLGRAVVPDGQVALAPLPADGLLGPGDVFLEQPDQVACGLRGVAEHAPGEPAEDKGT